MKKLLTLAGLAAGLTYFFDPQQGKRRRAMVAQKTGGLFRTGVKKGERAGRAVGSQAYGVTQKVAHARGDESKDLTDETLKSKVETEIFRDADAPKGKVDVNVVDGVVYLRGEVEPDLIDDLVKATKKVSGVKSVENLLHTPGTPAPTASESPSSS
jgi:osmotically-inducible protein OsmY